MANLRAIRTRIKSVENTQQITKSMKMVAGAKLRRTQSAYASLPAALPASTRLRLSEACDLYWGSAPNPAPPSLSTLLMRRIVRS